MEQNYHRYFIELSYLGEKYNGWQIQDNAPSIQGLLNSWISKILNTEVYCMGCGRTDTGVHAHQYFAHFETYKIIDPKKLINQLNKVLPDDIVIKSIFEVNHNAHPRFTALDRTYKYFIHTEKNPFKLSVSSFMQIEVDIDKMNELTPILLSHKDYTALSKVSETEPHYLCNIKYAHWEQNNADFTFTVTANRFTRGLVRILVGTMLEVGKGKITKSMFRDILETKDRKRAGSSAPPQGLFLWQVSYPKEIYELK